MWFWFCRYKNQNVAIKIVHKGDNPEEAAKREARFMREVNMLSRVQHKNLVKVSMLLNFFCLCFFCFCWCSFSVCMCAWLVSLLGLVVSL